MPINPNQQLDPDQRRYSLPVDSCVGDGVGDPFAGGKAGPKPAAAQMSAPKGGNPRIGGK